MLNLTWNSYSGIVMGTEIKTSSTVVVYATIALMRQSIDNRSSSNALIVQETVAVLLHEFNASFWRNKMTLQFAMTNNEW